MNGTLVDATLYALALGCPRCLQQENCLLSRIHRLPISMRFSAIRALTQEQRQEVLKGHEDCIGSVLRYGPLVEICKELLKIEQRIGTPGEQPGDLDRAVLTAHQLRNMMFRIMAEDGDILMS